jgi:aminoglycoside phosphotransferase (APT) family kinase protein
VAAGDIVETAADAEGLAKPPLLVLDRVRTFLDEHGLGSGEIRARRIGEGGGSNFTFLLERGSDRLVLRRPPRPPLPPTAHDVVREARLQLALREAGFARLPTILAVCDDESVLGVPFYVMAHIVGFVPTEEVPPGLERESSRRALGGDLVDALVEIHAADVTTPGLAAFARPGSYNERQVRRFSQLWELNKTREIASVDEVGAWLAGHVPDPLLPTVVHGDYRLGNTMVAPDEPSRIVAVLDWEMGAIGDPRADVGYLLATYSEPGGPPNPLGTSPITALAGFPSKADLVEEYVAGSGRDVEPLPWFEALALWKAAVFCEAIYGRCVRSDSGTAFRTSPRRRQPCCQAPEAQAHRFRDAPPYSVISARARSASGCWAEARSDVAPDSRQASIRSAIRSFGPTSATSSTNASGIAAAASRFKPSR